MNPTLTTILHIFGRNSHRMAWLHDALLSEDAVLDEISYTIRMPGVTIYTAIVDRDDDLIRLKGCRYDVIICEDTYRMRWTSPKHSAELRSLTR